MNKAIVLYGEVAAEGVIELAEMQIPGSPEQLMNNELNVRVSAGLFSPGGELALGDIARHHILPADLLEKPTFERYQPPEGFDTVIVFAKSGLLPRLKLDEDVTVVVAKSLFRTLWPGLDDHSLDSIIYMVGFKCGDANWARTILNDNSEKGSLKRLNLLLVAIKYLLGCCRDSGVTVTDWSELTNLDKKIQQLADNMKENADQLAQEQQQ